MFRVEDSHVQPPSIPFWLGEAPARTQELSESVSRLRAEVAQRVDVGTSCVSGWVPDHPPANTGGTDSTIDSAPDPALSPRYSFASANDWLVNEVGLSFAAAEQIAGY